MVNSYDYPALYPGESRYRDNWNTFRSTWESVPLLEGELKVTRGRVIFRHLTAVDENYLLGNRR